MPVLDAGWLRREEAALVLVRQRELSPWQALWLVVAPSARLEKKMRLSGLATVRDEPPASLADWIRQQSG